MPTFGLLVLLGLSIGWIIYTQRERDRLRQALRRYDTLVSQEEAEAELSSDIRVKQRELEQITEKQEQLKLNYEQSLSQAEFDAELSSKIQQKQRTLSELVRTQEHLNIQINNLQQNLGQLKEEYDLQVLGFYEPKYDFISSELYQKQFNYIVSERKKMIKNGAAAICQKTWTVGEDAKKGRRMIDDYLKLLRGTFDNTCDSAISNARSNNVEKLEKNIKDVFERLNKWSRTLECEITEKYLQLRLRELDLKYEMEVKKQEERDRDKMNRERVAKDKKEREAIEKARQEEEEAIQRKLQHEQDIERIRQEIEESVGQQRKALELQMQELERLRAKAQSDEEDAVSRFRKLKSGFVYVISSIGSFEQGIYRICMTQSSDPDKYVRDMNPVVPFPFDVYFKIFSEDALDTLNRLHQIFQDRRVNKRNLRREFFRASLDEIDQAINEIARETPYLKNIQRFEAIPLADEYRWSRVSQQQGKLPSFSAEYRNDEIA